MYTRPIKSVSYDRRFRKITLLICLFFAGILNVTGQFQGKLVYEIEMVDTNLRKINPIQTMVILTNDTVVRTENETQAFGKQVALRHMQLNKTILLVQTEKGNFAVRTTQSIDSSENQFDTKKKMFKSRRILGQKAKLIQVKKEGETDWYSVYYFKKWNNRIIDGMQHIPGLPVDFTLASVDGEVHFRLVAMERNTPNRNLFGVPDNYQKVSLDEFVELLNAE